MHQRLNKKKKTGGAGAAGNRAGCHGGAAAATPGAGGGGLHGEESGEGDYPGDAGPYVPVQHCLL